MNGMADFKSLQQAALNKSNRKKPKAVLVVPSDIAMLRAFVNASEMNLIEPVIIGDEKLLRSKCDANEISLPDMDIFDIIEPVKAVEMAARMAVDGVVDMIIKGKFEIFSFIDLLKDPSLEFVKKNNLTHVSVFKTEKYPKLLIVSDSYANIEPDLNQKVISISNSVNTAVSLGIENPKVALLSAVETVTPQMPVTVDAAVISKMNERNQIKNCVVDGPLSFDIAIDSEAAAHKGIKNSQVAGNADILIAPNMATAQGIFKAVSLFTDSDTAHILAGGKVPVVFACEFENEADRLNSIMLGVLVS